MLLKTYPTLPTHPTSPTKSVPFLAFHILVRGLEATTDSVTYKSSHHHLRHLR